MWRRPFCELIQPSSSLASGVTARLGEAEPGRVAGSDHASIRLGAATSAATAATPGAASSPDPPQPASASAVAIRVAVRARLGMGTVLVVVVARDAAASAAACAGLTRPGAALA